MVADRWQNHYHWNCAMMRLSHRFLASASFQMPIFNWQKNNIEKKQTNQTPNLFVMLYTPKNERTLNFKLQILKLMK